ncbi:MAG: hypothetical protein WD205_05205, partial [Rhodothermales bacterium]
RAVLLPPSNGQSLGTSVGPLLDPAEMEAVWHRFETGRGSWKQVWNLIVFRAWQDQVLNV